MKWSDVNPFKKKNSGARVMYVRSYMRPGGNFIGGPSRRRGPNWKSIGLIAAALAALALIIWGAISLLGGGSGPTPTPTPTPVITPMPSPTPLPTPTPTIPPGSSEDWPLQSAADVMRMASKERNINMPGSYGDFLAYGAGTGSVSREMVFKTLYLYNLQTGEETPVATVSQKSMEIASTLINERWIVWVETDHQGNSLIRRYDRAETDASKQIMDIKNVDDATPHIVMYASILLFTEKTDGIDHVRMFDLSQNEDISITQLSDPGAYGVSPPAIWGDQIVWAASDPDQTPQQRAAGEKSVVYYAEISKLGEYETDEDGYVICPYWKADMYVHRPVTNGRAWAWIDTNGAPNSKLWVRYNGQVQMVAEGPTMFFLTSNYLVYGHNAAVWAYSLEEGTYTRLSPESETSCFPLAVYGERVLWFSNMTEGEKDNVETMLLP